MFSFQRAFTCCILINVASAFLLINTSYAAGVSDVIKQDDELRALDKDRQKAIKESLPQAPDQLHQTNKTTFQLPELNETPCFSINKINLIGEEANAFSWLLKDLGAFTNQCLGVKSLEILQSNLNNRLLEAGYVTSRVMLPDQKLGEGHLNLQMEVGLITDFRIEDKRPLDSFTMPWATWRNAVPIAKNDVLNIRDLDQSLEQLKRLPSQNVAIVIEPAESENDSVLVIKRQQESRLRSYASVDNSGSSSLGREQLQMGATLDAPLGVNDQLSLNMSSNTQNVSTNHRNQSASVFYSIPFGYSTFSASFGYSRFGQIVQGTTVQFLSSGFSQNAEAKWHTTFLRDASSKFGLYGQLSTRRARSYLEDVELLVQQRRTTAAELGITYTKKWQNANFNLETGYSWGLPWFEAESQYFDSSASDQPTTRPNIWRGSAELDVPIAFISDSLNYNGRFRWQMTPKQTLSIDQFGIGSRYSVRGFDGDIILQGESGFNLRNEFSMSGFSLWNNQLVLSPYLAVDVGHLWGPTVKDSQFTTLAGAAIGLRTQASHVYADFSLGTPLYKPEDFPSHRINPMFQLTINI